MRGNRIRAPSATYVAKSLVSFCVSALRAADLSRIQMTRVAPRRTLAAGRDRPRESADRGDGHPLPPPPTRARELFPGLGWDSRDNFNGKSISAPSFVSRIKFARLFSLARTTTNGRDPFSLGYAAERMETKRARAPCAFPLPPRFALSLGLGAARDAERERESELDGAAAARGVA